MADAKRVQPIDATHASRTASDLSKAEVTALIKCARYWVKRYRKLIDRSQELCDIDQQAILIVLQRLSWWNPERGGLVTFASIVLRQELPKYLISLRTGYSAGYGTDRPFVQYHDKGHELIHESFSTERKQRRSTEDETVLRVDVHKAIERLSDHEQAILREQLLLQHKNRESLIYPGNRSMTWWKLKTAREKARKYWRGACHA